MDARMPCDSSDEAEQMRQRSPLEGAGLSIAVLYASSRRKIPNIRL